MELGICPGNTKLRNYVRSYESLCQPESVKWCSGTEEEINNLCALLVKRGTLVPLNEKSYPNSFVCRTDPRDADAEEDHSQFTYVCSQRKSDAGPTNLWQDPVQMKVKMDQLLKGSMEGRTMYVIPFCLGPVDSPYARFGVEVTDSPYVAVLFMRMTRVGESVMAILGKSEIPFIPAIHSVGCPSQTWSIRCRVAF